MLSRPAVLLLLLQLILAQPGCMLIPDVAHQPRYHNPFPQLSRVAIVPFFNLSAEPTVNQDRFALAYYSALQAIPGFEVVPVGVVRRVIEANQIRGNSEEEFRRLAQLLDVDVVVAGAVTDYSPYYPPRLGLAVNWYAANPCFHPIPPGYGLPWGTSEEEFIPEELVHAAEFALAREQLKTQTPRQSRAGPLELDGMATIEPDESKGASRARSDTNSCLACPTPTPARTASRETGTVDMNDAIETVESADAPLPDDWPDPRGFLPPPPSPVAPECTPHHGPIISHIRTYHGTDSDFTTALENYFYFRDEARFGGWQNYLQRSEDFIRFCCHLHVTETLAARGGAGKTRVVWRWPISRYER